MNISNNIIETVMSEHVSSFQTTDAFYAILIPLRALISYHYGTLEASATIQFRLYKMECGLKKNCDAYQLSVVSAYQGP